MVAQHTPDIAKVAYIGNFGPEHSTESMLARAFEHTGYEVQRLQENQDWWPLVDAIHPDVDLVLWTRTWDVPYSVALDAKLNGPEVPWVGYHLDRWHGLLREHQVREQAFFKVPNLVITADGHPAHHEAFMDAGVRHAWLPPGVERRWCVEDHGGERLFERDLAFVGSWKNYHPEWLGYRQQLIRTLQEAFGGRFAVWPNARSGQARIVGERLSRLYQSTKVVVGDSCLAPGSDGQTPAFYCSDRIPETLGRGGLLVHPYVEGVTGFPSVPRPWPWVVNDWEAFGWVPGLHLLTYPLHGWDALVGIVTWLLAPEQDGLRARIAKAGRAHTLAHHTWEVRARQIIDLAFTGQVQL